MINLEKLTKYFLYFISIIIIWGTIVYRIYSLNIFGVIFSLLLSIATFIILIFLYKDKCQKTELLIRNIPIFKKNLIETFSFIPYFSAYIISLSLSIFYIFKAKTAESIISPWQLVNWQFFLFYFISVIFLILFVAKNKKYGLFLIVLHYIFSFSIALIVYKIGYGYDSFIHEATLKLIDEKGVIFPKPFYYLGQYSLVIILHKITFIPIVWLNKLLVPILSGLFLPIALFFNFKKILDVENEKIKLLIIILLLFPFSFFIVSTPQNLAFLFLLLTLIYGLNTKSKKNFIFIFLLSVSAFLIHPIAGIPAIIFTVLLYINCSDIKPKIKKLFYGMICLFNVFLLPLAFFITEKIQNFSPDNGQETSEKIFKPLITIPNDENVIINFVYLYIFNFKFIFALFILSGLIICYKYRNECRIFLIYLSMSFTLFLSYIITKYLSFGYLISYERDDYSNRILVTACFFLLPFIATTIYNLIEKILLQNNSIKYTILVFTSILVTVSLYASYPRYDDFFNSHGYSVGQNDIDTVRLIKNDSQNDYIVLANQQVSAAALREFGFDKYYKDDIFYYPIPTGAPLYQYYLDMVYKKPTRDTMFAAMDLAGVNEGYFVLNKYWWGYKKIADEAKLETDSWQEIDSGELIVFKYSK